MRWSPATVEARDRLGSRQIIEYDPRQDDAGRITFVALALRVMGRDKATFNFKETTNASIILPVRCAGTFVGCRVRTDGHAACRRRQCRSHSAGIQRGG